MTTYFDRDALLALIQKSIAPSLADVSWDYQPPLQGGYSQLATTGEALPGALQTAPAASGDSSGPCVVTCSVTSWVGKGWDDTVRTQGMGPVVATGTGPTITVTGDPTEAVKNLDVKVSLGGARGTWKLKYSIDGLDVGDIAKVWIELTSAATVVLGSTGLTLHIATGTATLGDTWFSRVIQVLTNQGLRHFTLTIKAESDTINPWNVIERMRQFWYFKSTKAGLPALRLALRDVSDTRNVGGPTWDGRNVQAALFEVQLTYATETVDLEGETGSDVPNNWIEKVGTFTFRSA